MTARGWNRCDCCCRFFSPERDGILIEEVHSMDINGNVSTDWPVVCGRCVELIHPHDWFEEVST